jgi:hypothetical protein
VKEKVQEYLRKSKEQELIRRGLKQRKYYKTEELTPELMDTLDFDDKKSQYYEIGACDVTDEEYREILKVPIAQIDSKSSLPYIFFVISAILFLGGLIVGIKVAIPKTFLDSFNWQLAMIIWFSSFITGIIFIGFGKIIELLDEINNK